MCCGVWWSPESSTPENPTFISRSVWLDTKKKKGNYRNRRGVRSDASNEHTAFKKRDMGTRAFLWQPATNTRSLVAARRPQPLMRLSGWGGSWEQPPRSHQLRARAPASKPNEPGPSQRSAQCAPAAPRSTPFGWVPRLGRCRVRRPRPNRRFFGHDPRLSRCRGRRPRLSRRPLGHDPRLDRCRERRPKCIVLHGP